MGRDNYKPKEYTLKSKIFLQMIRVHYMRFCSNLRGMDEAISVGLEGNLREEPYDNPRDEARYLAAAAYLEKRGIIRLISSDVSGSS